LKTSSKSDPASAGEKDGSCSRLRAMKSTTRGRKVEDRNHGFLIHFNASLRLEEEFLFAKLCI